MSDETQQVAAAAAEIAADSSVSASEIASGEIKSKPQQKKGGNKKDKKEKKDKAQAGQSASVPEPPAYIGFREDIFEELWAEQQKELAERESKAITITLPDGKQVPGETWRTSPYDIAKGI
ncbi:uncharacterized protein MONBRDRAFT_12212, partial [Monosiga brevicollis MX1]